MRAYRVALEPTAAQEQALRSHVGAARAAYNYHLAAKRAAHRAYTDVMTWATYDQFGHLPPADALAQARKLAGRQVKFPSAAASTAAFCADPQFAWRVEVNRYAISSGMRAAEQAWRNWLDSVTMKRKGRRVGYPRFRRRKVTGSGTFTLYHDKKSKTPGLRLDGYRRLRLPKLVGGSIRLKGNLRRLGRLITRGRAVISSVTIRRGGRQWYASVLVEEIITIPDRPTPTQRRGGTVGVDLGVHHLAALSTGKLVDNPRHLAAATKRLARAQRALDRTGWVLLDGNGQPTRTIRAHQARRGMRLAPTAGRIAATQRLARAHADLAERRATALHALTKTLATRYALVAIEDLNVAGMTRSARGTLAVPGRNVRAKSGLNRGILDAGFGEIRRQLAYKTSWYGSTLAVIGRFAPTSKTCSACGAVKAKLPLRERQYHCDECHQAPIDRDVNAARNIATLGARLVHDVAPGNEETRNARPRDGRDPTNGSTATDSTTREDPAPIGTGPPMLPKGIPSPNPPTAA